MCGRMTLSRRDLDEVADELETVCPPEMAARHRPRFNVAPTDSHPILRLRTGSSGPGSGEPRELAPASWGLGLPGKGPLHINARSETAATKDAFREAFARRRCAIPADGFYEWEGQGPTRRPFWLRSSAGRLLLFAGLYSEQRGELRFTILTTAASPDVAALHDRMPVLLAGDQVTAWLRDGGPSLLHPAPGGTLVASPVSRRVNSVKNDDPDCLLPEAEGTRHESGTLEGPEPPAKLRAEQARRLRTRQDRQLRLFPL